MSSGSLTTLIILVTLLHVAAFAVMIMIRLRREDRDRATAADAAPCAVCSAPSTHLGYDGLDPEERRDPHTGRPYSTDITHYQPVCAAH